MDRRQFRIIDIISLILSVVTLITMVSAGFFWFYKTNELPNRVMRTEDRLDKIEKQLVENQTKIDLIYQGVIEIRSVLLKR